MASLPPDVALATARLVASNRAPYFRAALYSLIPRKSTAVETLAVTADAVMVWNPEWVAKQPVTRLAAGLVHEVQHLLRKHHARMLDETDRGAVNIAQDCEINDDLEQGKWDVDRDDWFFPRTLGEPDNQLAEAYLKSAKRQQRKPRPCGGCAGNPAPGEPPAKPGQPGGGRNETEIDRMRRTVAADVQAHAAAHGRGSVPGDLLVWANGVLAPPKVDWRTKLARLLRGAVAYRPGAIEYRRDGISRRQYGAGVGPGSPMLARMRSPLPRVAVGIDTSGSMLGGELERAVAEAGGVLKAVGGQVTLLACDTALHAVKPVRTVKDILPLMKGGGGSDMGPIFEAVSALRPLPEVFVLFTDGDVEAPRAPPKGYKTIWALVGHRATPPVAWGDSVQVDRDGETQEAA